MDAGGSARDRGLNVARGIAVLLIFVAQTSPGRGPFQVLVLSEYIPPALLAVLIGMTAQVARDRRAGWQVNLLWGVALMLFGVLLAQVPSQIPDILFYLGLLGVLTGALVRVPTAPLVVLMLAVLAVEPWLKSRATHWHAEHLATLHVSWSGRRMLELVDLLAGAPSYRTTALVVYCCAGLLLIRLVVSDHNHGPMVGAAGVLALGVNAVSQAGGPHLEPGTGTVQVLVFNTLIAVAIAEAGRWMGSKRSFLVETLADVGGMWLTMYVFLVLSSTAYLATDPPNGRDDSWRLMVLLLVGGAAFASIWVHSLRGTWLEQGPIEGPLELLSGQEPTFRDEPGQSFRRRT